MAIEKHASNIFNHVKKIAVFMNPCSKTTKLCPRDLGHVITLKIGVSFANQESVQLPLFIAFSRKSTKYRSVMLP